MLDSTPFQQKVLGWFDRQGDRYLTTDELADAERQRPDAALRRVEELQAKLRSLSISERECL